MVDAGGIEPPTCRLRVVDQGSRGISFHQQGPHKIHHNRTRSVWLARCEDNVFSPSEAVSWRKRPQRFEAPGNTDTHWVWRDGRVEAAGKEARDGGGPTV
jgi:hypothetical protein